MLLAALGGLAGLLLGAVLWGHLLGEGGAGQPLVLALGQGGAGVVLLALCAALGATVGTAALPFAGEGPALVVRSLAHFALTALEVLLLLRLCFQVKRPDYLAGWLGILAGAVPAGVAGAVCGLVLGGGRPAPPPGPLPGAQPLEMAGDAALSPLHRPAVPNLPLGPHTL